MRLNIAGSGSRPDDTTAQSSAIAAIAVQEAAFLLQELVLCSEALAEVVEAVLAKNGDVRE